MGPGDSGPGEAGAGREAGRGAARDVTSSGEERPGWGRGGGADPGESGAGLGATAGETRREGAGKLALAGEGEDRAGWGLRGEGAQLKQFSSSRCAREPPRPLGLHQTRLQHLFDPISFP